MYEYFSNSSCMCSHHPSLIHDDIATKVAALLAVAVDDEEIDVEARLHDACGDLDHELNSTDRIHKPPASATPQDQKMRQPPPATKIDRGRDDRYLYAQLTRYMAR